MIINNVIMYYDSEQETKLTILVTQPTQASEWMTCV